ncbi:hypothetical protein [Mixta gaviniae]|uniref:Uncharacterized protein n=1 Tax=Mixta gaviniae TaxID=665914 RepID=A0A2L0ICJ8_9GAMM|nr:hypothetical protein [Mixta gaviniae]AUX92293.1 hypothetical protein C2E15_03795 [Mixta gaviniae]
MLILKAATCLANFVLSVWLQFIMASGFIWMLISGVGMKGQDWGKWLTAFRPILMLYALNSVVLVICGLLVAWNCLDKKHVLCLSLAAVQLPFFYLMAKTTYGDLFFAPVVWVAAIASGTGLASNYLKLR